MKIIFNPFFYGNSINMIKFKFHILKLWTISYIFCNLYFCRGLRFHPEKSNLKKSLFFQNGGRYGLRKVFGALLSLSQ
jgi:hypothetical protein